MKLSEAAREAQRQYVNEWRRKNPDKLKQYRVNYWERKAAELNSGESIEAKI